MKTKKTEKTKTHFDIHTQNTNHRDCFSENKERKMDRTDNKKKDKEIEHERQTDIKDEGNEYERQTDIKKIKEMNTKDKQT
jgi:hypothetical protein